MADEITTITKRAAALLKAGCDPAALGDALKLFDPLEYASSTVESEARGFIRSRPHFRVQSAEEAEPEVDPDSEEALAAAAGAFPATYSKSGW